MLQPVLIPRVNRNFKIVGRPGGATTKEYQNKSPSEHYIPDLHASRSTMKRLPPHKTRSPGYNFLPRRSSGAPLT